MERLHAPLTPLLLILIAAGVGACCSSNAPPGSSVPDASDRTGDEDSQYCHWDCFGYHECADGVVTTWDHTPVPCEYWTGMCPHYQSYVCERGCRIDANVLYEPFIQPREMCEEWRPKQLGDPCTQPSDCDPQVATIDSGGSVVNVYLQCDIALGECVARDPPVVADYLAQCGVTAPFGQPDAYEYGFVRTSVCAGGLCLILDDGACVMQGCTIACDSDDDCPMGSVCQLFEDWTGGIRALRSMVCKPGRPNLVGVDLACP